MGVIRNLVTLRDIAVAVGTRTRIPAVAVDCLVHSIKPLYGWTQNSLEDSSLMLLIHLAQHEECLSPLRSLVDEAMIQALGKLQGTGSIHEVRASALLARLVPQRQPSLMELKLDEKKEIDR